MFYSQYVLARKGALARIWLAAHWDRKLTKALVFSTNISSSVESIINPEVPMALRMSSHLLLGVTRIYFRKVKYLLTDCNDALVKIKLAFRPGEAAQIDLDPTFSVANKAAITLPETNYELEINIPDITDVFPIPEEKDLLNVNLARKQEITLRVSEIEESRKPILDSITFPMVPRWDEDPLNLQELPEVARLDEAPPETVFAEPSVEFEVAADFEPTEGISLRETPLKRLSTELGYDFEAAKIPTPLSTEISRMSIEGTPIITVKPTKIPKISGVLVDRNTVIDSRSFKRSLDDTSEIVGDFVPAPSTKRAMIRKEKELAGSETLFQNPTMEGLAPELVQLFQRNIATGKPVISTLPEVEELSTMAEPIGDFSVMETMPYEGEELPEPFIEPSIPLVELEPQVEKTIEVPQDLEEEQRLAEEPNVETWSERTRRMHRYLSNNFTPENEELSYLEMVKGRKRKIVIGTFFELLVLKTKDIVDIQQSEPYGDILIRKTNIFDIAVA